MELQDLVAPLKRWWWLLVAAGLTAAVLSLVVSLRQPSIYRSSSTVMIGRAIDNPNPSDAQLYTSQQLAATYADIATRQPVRQGVMKSLGLHRLPEYVVRPVPNTQLLEIAVTDTDAQRAQAVADEIANQLILQSPTNKSADQTRQEFINQQLDELQVKIQDTQNEMDARQSELASQTNARQIADTQNQISALQSRLDTLRTNYTQLLSNSQSGALNTITIIEPAVLPEKPVGPDVPLIVLVAMVLALTVSVGSVYLLAALDNAIKSPAEIKRLSGLSMLAGVQSVRSDNYPDMLITVRQPRSPVAESYRSLRTCIQFSTINQMESKALLVTSPNPSEGKSMTAANLAVVFAQAGLRTLIIDSDLRRPMLHKIFSLDNNSGLTELLRNIKISELDETLDAWFDTVVRHTSVDGLQIMTSGPIPPNPSELLGSNTYHLLLNAMKKRFDYIIVDSPPVLVITDSVVLSARMDGVLLVIDADRTQKNQLRQAADRLREVNTNMLGVVVNRLSSKMQGYQDYFSYYDYQKSGDGAYGFDSNIPGSYESKYHPPKRRGAGAVNIHTG